MHVKHLHSDSDSDSSTAVRLAGNGNLCDVTYLFYVLIFVHLLLDSTVNRIH